MKNFTTIPDDEDEFETEEERQKAYKRANQLLHQEMVKENKVEEETR